ncbi:methylated-DNA--[protein]-cysteine S-methyltransferase [Bowmanella sp. Y26]|uniref:methylated-DNA--[protein]-cysteine S-methyltransferase n=1 Tax=Bowmanella yangjiangensis TaxID=2811230 RepID=UPI001BDCA911|nr:methylated-DNA--[protein]-cysteine S-methyltransferase [Bowmanella yangjiangensis]
MPSPIGLIELCANPEGIQAITFVDTQTQAETDTPILKKAAEQLAEYFNGHRQDFDLPLAAGGTAFQQQVWHALVSIPFGQTGSYLDIARKIGNPAAVRAVGAANGKNPLSIVVPCHRIIGSNGNLTGYAGGLERKAWLLQHEQSQQRLGDW